MDTFYQYAVLLDQRSGFVLMRDAVFNKHNSERLASFKEKGYSGLLRSFYDDTDIASLWKSTDDMWCEVQRDCNACLQTSKLGDFLELFFGASPYRMAFVPNPLDPPTFGFGLNDGTTAYCTFGPPTIALDGEEPVKYSSYGNGLTYNAFHEFAHSLLNNAIDKWPAIIDETKTVETTMTLKGWFPNMYQAWDNRFKEIFIRAATALYREQLEGEASARAMLDKEKQDFGIDIIDRMFLCLRDYLYARRRNEFRNLGEYLPSLSRELLERKGDK